MKHNPFKLYDEGEYYCERNRKATKEVKEAWKKFVRDIQELYYRYEDVGLRDTQSRECVVDWVKKHVEDIY